MTPLPRPDVILTHESDLDGFLAGLLLQSLARKLFGVSVPLQAYHNHVWRQRAPIENAAWVCDLAFEARLDRPNWLIVDHHPLEARPERAQVVHDPNKSAGLLCYELCREQGLGTPALDRLVHLSDVADRFLEDDPDFTLATDYANLVKTYQFWNLHDLVDGEPERLVDHPLLEVMAVKRRVEDPLGFAWCRRNVTEVVPGVGYVRHVVGNTNLIVHQMLEQRVVPHAVLVTFVRRGNGLMLVSLRSRDGAALPIAEKLQGGGHPNACGAVLPRAVRNAEDAVRYLRQILNPAPNSRAGLTSLEGVFAELERSQPANAGRRPPPGG